MQVLSHPPVMARKRWARPPLLASVSARLHAFRIDDELAAGVASWRSPAHAARAVQLTTRGRRRSLAGSLERLVSDAERPPVLTAAVRPCFSQVLDAKPTIVAVAARLRSPEPVDARGVARLLALLSDGAGPCYVPSRPGALTSALQTAIRWLEPPD
jgi:hypothetical protein